MTALSEVLCDLRLHRWSAELTDWVWVDGVWRELSRERWCRRRCGASWSVYTGTARHLR